MGWGLCLPEPYMNPTPLQLKMADGKIILDYYEHAMIMSYASNNQAYLMAKKGEEASFVCMCSRVVSVCQIKSFRSRAKSMSLA